MIDQTTAPIGLRILAFITSVLLLYLPLKFAPDELYDILDFDFGSVESGVKSSLLFITGFCFALLFTSFIWSSTLRVLTSLLVPEAHISNNLWVNALYLGPVSILLAGVLISHHIEVVEKPQMEEYDSIE